MCSIERTFYLITDNNYLNVDIHFEKFIVICKIQASLFFRYIPEAICRAQSETVVNRVRRSAQSRSAALRAGPLRAELCSICSH